MHKYMLGMILLGACWLSQRASAQDVPGLGAGAFFEQRTENKIGGEDLTLSYYGIRLRVRDERFVDGFVDLGSQALDIGPFEADDAGCYGLGGTFWLTRAYGDGFPTDLGVYGSYHVADYTIQAPVGRSTDAKYSDYLAQGIVRLQEGPVAPYLRVGMLGSKLDPDDDSVLPAEGLDNSTLAVNVGAEVALGEKIVVTLEGNYSEGVGAAARLDYWF